MEKKITDLSEIAEFENVLIGIDKLSRQMDESIVNKKDGIWEFVLRSAYIPALYQKSFDYVIGNPPWISLRNLGGENYQNHIKWTNLFFQLVWEKRFNVNGYTV